MPSRDWQLRIMDILQAVQDIEQFTQGMSFEEFSKNKMVVQSGAFQFGTKHKYSSKMNC